MKKITLLLFLVLTSTGTMFASTFKAPGYTKEISQKKYNFKNFSQLRLSNAIDVQLKISNTYSIKAIGSSKQLESIDINRSGKLLTIKIKDRSTNRNWWGSSSDKSIKIELTMPLLDYLKMSGATSFEVSNLDQEELKVYLSGASDAKLKGKLKHLKLDLQGASSMNVNMDLQTLKLESSGASNVNIEGDISKIDLGLSGASDCFINSKSQHVTIDLSGSSDLKLDGESDYLKLRASGSSDLEAFDFHAKKADLSLSGSSDANVSVSRELRVNSSGGSDVVYKGKPSLSMNSSGGSNVRSYTNE